MYLVESLLQQKKDVEALSYCRYSLASTPESTLTGALINQIYQQWNDQEGLIEEWRTIVSAHPEAVTPRVYLGMALEEANALTEALAHYEYAVLHAAENVQALCKLGALQLRLNMFEDGEKTLEKAMQVDQALAHGLVVVIYGDAAERLFEAGEFGLAEKYYQRAISLDTKNILHYVGFGRTLESLDRPDAALEVYREVIQYAQESLVVADYIDAIYNKREDLPGRIQAWRDLSAAQPEAAVPLLHLGMALEAIGEVQSALSLYNQVLQLNPNLAATHEKIRRLHAEQ